MTFGYDDCAKDKGIIKVPTIGRRGVMDFMIDVCVQSKKRSQVIFPLADPTSRDDATLPVLSREIFADAISNLIAIWTYIWSSIED